jgi:hypothetical protein
MNQHCTRWLRGLFSGCGAIDRSSLMSHRFPPWSSVSPVVKGLTSSSNASEHEPLQRQSSPTPDTFNSIFCRDPSSTFTEAPFDSCDLRKAAS